MLGFMISKIMNGLTLNSLTMFLDGITQVFASLLFLLFLNGNTSSSVEAPVTSKKEETELSVK